MLETLPATFVPAHLFEYYFFQILTSVLKEITTATLMLYAIIQRVHTTALVIRDITEMEGIVNNTKVMEVSYSAS